MVAPLYQGVQDLRDSEVRWVFAPTGRIRQTGDSTVAVGSVAGRLNSPPLLIVVQSYRLRSRWEEYEGTANFGIRDPNILR